jgi:hypothetical protein
MEGRETCDTDVILPKMSDEILAKIITATMAMPLSQAQLIIPGLEKYTLFDIEESFKKCLKIAPPTTKIIEDLPFEDLFTLEEDFLLLSSVRFNYDINVLLSKYGSSFHQVRSKTSLLKRREQLKAMKPEEKERIIDDMTKMIIAEDAYFLSTENTSEMEEERVKPEDFIHLRCSYEAEEKRKPAEHINGEIDKLMKVSKIIAGSCVTKNDRFSELATLRGANVYYSIKREAVLIGRATSFADIDIDLAFEGEKSCLHVSRRQAILYFLYDCNFYIENVGNRPFRVNGFLINPGKTCRVSPFAILDFSGILLMFIPNEKFIDEIRKFVSLNTH